MSDLIYTLILPTLFLGIFKISSNLNGFLLGNKKNILTNTFCFLLIIVFFYLYVSYSFIFKLNTNLLLKIFLTIFFIFGLLNIYKIFRSKNYNDINVQLKLFFSKKTNIFIFTIFLLYVFAALTPPADLDSLRYHLEIPKNIIEGRFYEKITSDYAVIGSNEFLNYIGSLLNFQNTSSVLDVLILLFVYQSSNFLKKNYKIGSGNFSTLMILICPYFVSLLTSQKLFLLPCYIVVFSYIYINLKKGKLNFEEIILISTLNLFCLTVKFSFLFFIIVNLSLILFYRKNFIQNLFLVIFFLFMLLLLLFPLFYIKYEVFKDPLVPLYIFSPENSLWIHHFKEYMLNYDRPLNLINLLKLPINLIFPLNFDDLFKIFGFGAITLFLINYKNKNYFLLKTLLIFTSCVLITQNVQIRWFLPILLIAIIYYNRSNKFHGIFRKLIYLQSIAIILVLFIFHYFAFPSLIADKFKNKYLEKFVSGYNISHYLNKNFTNYNILSDIQTSYYFDNFTPIYYYKFQKARNPLFIRSLISKNDNYILVSRELPKIKEIISDDEICSSEILAKKFIFNNRAFYEKNYLIPVYFVKVNKRENNCKFTPFS